MQVNIFQLLGTGILAVVIYSQLLRQLGQDAYLLTPKRFVGIQLLSGLLATVAITILSVILNLAFIFISE